MLKLELHAHLSGSIDTEFLLELAKSSPDLKLDNEEIRFLRNYGGCNLNECFKLFGIIHKILQKHHLIEKSIAHVIEKFTEDGVFYLELRSTLREMENSSKLDYLIMILQSINDHHLVQNGRILVNFLVSIDRARGVDCGHDSIEALKKCQLLRPDIAKRIVGVDLSGNPHVGNLMEYASLLNSVRDLGLKTTVHFAEIEDIHEEWLCFLLEHIPDRIGHATALLTSSEDDSKKVSEVVAIVRERKIPIEACLTSNIKCQSVLNYQDHHFHKWFQMLHPIFLCVSCYATVSILI
ncbi:hypothetical protein Ciccas_000578 [Cichlidogyrus casuarinus]|uniref:Adenosine deaminase domain-containing protein n=1 Tax=Cichlidogyrus casuarinus TaxID=1844966 RepID=A0ABD2QPS6_9PLAT